ncbi:hypothetical protein B296_00036885 [Ensete ventricosum]|uniref:Uncharacterized protein n=1 Tax=Ensete ventricosum TaxID=4639 RepID=A0A426X1L7_ENSVE|nr:hypothetical protein B296_00036885 [Ensete ventricosum]
MRALHSWPIGLFLHGFFFRFKGFFRCFIVLILRWFNHEELTLFAMMFAAPWFDESLPLSVDVIEIDWSEVV